MFQENLPDLADPIGLLPSEMTSNANPHLMRAHIGAHSAQLRLHSILVNEDDIAYKVVLDSALHMAEVVRFARGESGLSLLHLINPFLVSILPFSPQFMYISRFL